MCTLPVTVRKEKTFPLVAANRFEHDLGHIKSTISTQKIRPKLLYYVSKDLDQKWGSLMVKKSSKDLAYLKELIPTDLSMIWGTLEP